MSQLKIAAVGHVDHGKSTLLGRLLFETGSVSRERVAQAEARCAELGRPFEYAFLLDALQEEQARNITIDLCRFRFRTSRRSYVLIDAPGHKEFLKNMVSGAASADGVILLVDVAEGMKEQTRRHAYLIHLLGIQQVVVAINKMDRVSYSTEVFQRQRMEVESYLRRLGLHVLRSIPLAALHGENVTQRSRNLAWYKGPTLLEQLEVMEPAPTAEKLPVRFPIQDIYEQNGARIAVGRLESGTLREGDRLVFWPSGAKVHAELVPTWMGDRRSEVRAGHSFALSLSGAPSLGRGEIGSLAGQGPRVGTFLKVHLFWLGRLPLQQDKEYLLRLATVETRCKVVSIERVVQTESLESRIHDLEAVHHSEVAEVTLETRQPVPFDLFSEVPTTGRIVLVDREDVAGGGILTSNLA